MLQSTSRESLGIQLKDNVVIFDEAHNINDAVASIHSVSLDEKSIERAHSQLTRYFQKYQTRLKGSNVTYIKQLLLLLQKLISFLHQSLDSKSSG